MPISKQDVIRAAVQLERDGRKFYLDAAKKASSTLPKRMFESLAEDEAQHVEWIEKLSPGAKSAYEVSKATYQRLSRIFAEIPEETRRTARAARTDEEAINLAILMEVKSRDAYLKWGQESTDKAVKVLCDVLAGAEAYHKHVLENTRDYLNHSTDFFLQDKGVVELG
jgi:rubrerythrin